MCENVRNIDDDMRVRLDSLCKRYNENPQNFFTIEAMLNYESIGFDNPQKLAALIFMAEVHSGKYD